MTFARKLYLLIAAAMLGLVCLGTIGAIQIGKVFEAANYATVNSLPSVERLDDALEDLYKMRILTWRHITAGTAEEKSRHAEAMEALKKDQAAILSTYLREHISDENDRTMTGHTRAALDKYLAVNADVIALSSANDSAAAQRRQGEIQGIIADAEKSLKQQRDYNVRLAHEAGERAASTRSDAYFAAIGITLATTLAISVAGYWLVRRLVTRLREAIALADAVAEGDLTVRIAARGDDEFARLQRALSRMVETLTATIGEVKRSADAIATASGEIASGNTDLSARTEAQASALEQTASSMEELTGTVQQNAQGAENVRQLADQAAETARAGGRIVGDVVEKMDAITAASARIAEIIGVIDGIAFQTNILSLNAAVEAARAGEQGRGFAVVASEVRSLAQRSAGAAKEIKALIDDSVAKVRQGSALVDKAGASMQEIVGGVTRVADVIGTIAEASREQGAGIVQVNEAVTQMDGMTQQNAALVEQAAAAAVAMREHAEQLAGLVATFRLEQEAPGAQRPAHATTAPGRLLASPA